MTVHPPTHRGPSSASTRSAPPGMSMLEEIGTHRDAMLRFARRRIRDADLAEDAVQDAMTSAVAAFGSFRGQSALRTWLIGILGHKIQDTFRREGRYVRLHGESDDADALAITRLDDGRDSTDPVTSVARRRLGQALQGEIDAL